MRRRSSIAAPPSRPSARRSRRCTRSASGSAAAAGGSPRDLVLSPTLSKANDPTRVGGERGRSMNTNTNGRRTSTSVRRAVPALAIVALAIGLGACQTPPRGQAVPQAPVIQPCRHGSGGRRHQPAGGSDRRAARTAGPRGPAVHPELDRPHHRTARVRGIADRAVDVRFRGMPADRIEELTGRREPTNSEEFDGMPADRIVERSSARCRAAAPNEAANGIRTAEGTCLHGTGPLLGARGLAARVVRGTPRYAER